MGSANDSIMLYRLLAASSHLSAPQFRCINSDADIPAKHDAFLPTDLANSQLDTTAAASSSDGVIGTAMSLIDGLHDFTGLPWWATLSLTAVGDS